MSNLSNVYAYLRDKYTDLDMFYGKCPSYVRNLAGIDATQKIIFIFKEDLTRLSQSNRDDQSPHNNTNKSDSNFSFSPKICGSPLKDDNSINELINTSVASKSFAKNPWHDVEESYTPVTFSFAQEIVNDVSNNDQLKNSRGWLFVLCDSETKNPSFLLSYCFTKSNYIRGIANYHGVVKNDEISMDFFLRKQQCMIQRAKPEIHIESTFEIITDVSLKFINTMAAENCTSSHINPSSQVLLYQKVEIGKSHILCEQLWSQIQLLYMIKNDIVNAKNNTCDGTLLEPLYNYGSMKYEDLQKKVNEVLSDVVTLNENYEEVVDTSLEAVIKKVCNRPLLEITDQLWELLKYSSSFGDLRKALTFIFQISSRSSIVNIPMNKNRLAELIREVSQQRLAIPHLSSTEPLELLLEIGIEKVIKDYEFIFSESKICVLSDMNMGESSKIPQQMDANMNVRKSLAASAAEINQMTNRKTLLHGTGSLDSNNDLDGIKNSRFNEKESEAAISKMAQIHLAIEHILMMQNNLNLDIDYKQIVKKVLENPTISFEDLQAKKFDKLQIPINDTKVIQIVDKLIPNSQKIIVKSENKFKAVENVFYFNIEQIVPSLVRKENEGDTIDKSGDTFHFINYTSITSKY